MCSRISPPSWTFPSVRGLAVSPDLSSLFRLTAGLITALDRGVTGGVSQVNAFILDAHAANCLTTGPRQLARCARALPCAGRVAASP